MKKRKDAIFITIMTIVLLAMIVMSFMTFSSNIYKYSAEQSYVQMSNIASQTSNAIKIKMQEIMRYLRASSDIVAEFDDIHSQECFDKVMMLMSESNFERMWVVTPDGTAARADSPTRNNMNISGREFFKDAMNGNEGASTPLVSVSGGIYISVYVPIESDGTVRGVLYGTFMVDSFDDVLSVGGFNGSGYSYIFDDDGNIIFSSVHSKTDVFRINVFDYLGENALDSKEYDDFVKSVKSEESGILTFKKEDKTKYTNCGVDAGIYNWNVMVTIPNSVFVANEKVIEREALKLSVKMFIFFVIIAGTAAYTQYHARKKTQQAYEKVNAYNEKYKVVLAQTDNIIYDYDVENDTIYNTDEKALALGFDRQINNATAYLFEKGVIDEKFKNTHMDAVAQILNGEKTIVYECVVKAPLQNDYHWYKITLQNTSKDIGSGKTIIGVLCNIDKEKETQQRLEDEKKYKEKVLAEALCVYEFDVGAGKCEVTYRSEAIGTKFFDTERYYFMGKEPANIYPEDLVLIKKSLDMNALKMAYMNRVSEIKQEYRIKCQNGEWAWVEVTVHLIIDEENRLPKGSIYIKDIDERKKLESDLRTKAEHDALTGIFNRAAAQSKIDAVLATDSGENVHALLLFDVDKFKNVNDTYGHQEGDRLLKELAQQVTKQCRTTDIVCRLGGDEFIVFAENVKNDEIARKQAEKICNIARSIVLEQGAHASVSLGMAVAHKHGDSFDALYKRADKALYEAKESGRDKFVVYSE